VNEEQRQTHSQFHVLFPFYRYFSPYIEQKLKARSFSTVSGFSFIYFELGEHPKLARPPESWPEVPQDFPIGGAIPNYPSPKAYP
jgi:hypothetical protein